MNTLRKVDMNEKVEGSVIELAEEGSDLLFVQRSYVRSKDGSYRQKDYIENAMDMCDGIVLYGLENMSDKLDYLSKYFSDANYVSEEVIFFLEKASVWIG